MEDIYRMYSMYFKTKGWRHEVTDSNEATKGYKELIMKVEGEGVYGIMKFESGVHRVQRVPETESQDVFIPLLLLLQFFRKLKKWMWKLILQI